MRRFVSVAALFVACFLLVACSLPLALLAQNLNPTTTLARETGNNTSAADSFRTQSNGNVTPRNVSKLPLQRLLYPGSRTKIYAHFMPWFGGTSHMDVGYRSNSATQVGRQVRDMMSRGIHGVIIDWYGPRFKRENDTTWLIMREAERHPGRFEFAVMEDAGALKDCARTRGCSVTQRLIDDLNYAARYFYPSPAYMRVSGRPVVFFFGLGAYNIDWKRVRAEARGNPKFIHRNSGGFTHSQTNGSFAWLVTESKRGHTPGYMSLPYLDHFYRVGKQYPSKLPFGSAYPGFDDSLAAWGRNRYIGRYCGQTWVRSMARAGRHYDERNQLHAMQIVTWNDYEEGSAIESGIDNCLSVSASVSGTTLSWRLRGDGSDDTVDHFNLFISLDGHNLAKLSSHNVKTRSVDLARFNLPRGTYYLYVQAYGKPSIRNQMSSAVRFTIGAQTTAGSPPPPPPSSPSGGTTVGSGATDSPSAGSPLRGTLEGTDAFVQW